jgi:hypothetical protein
MWIKCHRDRFRATLFRSTHNFAQHLRVRPVNPIEIPNTHDGRTKVRGNVIEFGKDLHKRLVS